MKIVGSIHEIRDITERARMEGKIIGLVPTLGCLHEGHLILMRKGREEVDLLVISIFVNPIQFGQGEDYNRYPRDIEGDIKKVSEVGVDIVFYPRVEDIYPDNYYTFVTVEKITNKLCGASRPALFRGVATVVTKLFNIVRPHKAYFGEKDYQQLIVIRRLVKDLNMDIEIVGMPIIREADGLAMSSRNLYLTDKERISALSLNQALNRAREMVDKGEISAKKIISEMRAIIESERFTNIDYIAVCDSEDFEDIYEIKRKALIALAVNIGSTMLIDNCVVEVK
jgi:pantoate--beta-alanine ligase